MSDNHNYFALFDKQGRPLFQLSYARFLRMSDIDENYYVVRVLAYDWLTGEPADIEVASNVVKYVGEHFVWMSSTDDDNDHGMELIGGTYIASAMRTAPLVADQVDISGANVSGAFNDLCDADYYSIAEYEDAWNDMQCRGEGIRYGTVAVWNEYFEPAFLAWANRMGLMSRVYGNSEPAAAYKTLIKKLIGEAEKSRADAEMYAESEEDEDLCEMFD